MEKTLHNLHSRSRGPLVILLVVLPLILVANVYSIGISWIGIAVLAAYWIISSLVLTEISYSLFRIEFIYRVIFGLVGFLFLVGSGAAAATMIYALNIYLVSIILALNSGLLIWGYYKYRSGDLVESKLTEVATSLGGRLTYRLLGLATLALTIIGLGIAWSRRTDKFIMSPWEALSNVFGLIALISVFLLIVLFFFKRSQRIALILLVGCSILIHSYLIFVYRNGFGGDHWRHVSYEEQIIDERPIPPTLYSSQGMATVKVGPVTLPAVLTDSRVGYSFAWGSLALIGKLTSTDPLVLNIWLYPMLWAIGLPLLFYILGRLLEMRRAYALLFAALPLVFDLYQVGGSLSVPLSISLFQFVTWAILLILWMRGALIKPWLLIIITLLFPFQYPVVTIYWFLLLVPIALGKLNGRVGTRLNRSLLWFLYGLAVIFILLADTYESLSVILWSRLVHAGELVSATWGWVVNLVVGLRLPFTTVTDINWLNLVRWALVITGIIAVYTGTDPKLKRFLKPMAQLFAISILLSFIGNVLMDGLRLIIGRIDILLNLFTLPFIVYGIKWCIDQSRRKWPVVILTSLVISLMLFHNYTNAPTLKTVTGDELRMSEYLYDNALVNDSHPCVIGEEWQLLALQKVSRNRLQGGGFPVDRDFIQGEKDAIFYGILRDPIANHADLLNRAFDVTRADRCFYLFENRFSSNPDTLDLLTDVFGRSQQIGDVYLFTIIRDEHLSATQR
ncbi:MAG: hypothetical protein WC734_02090 [Patescibacteria group bacterium]|jgi:hypothetical protein